MPSHLRFERELEELRKELAEATAAAQPGAFGRTSPTPSEVEALSNDSSVVDSVEGEPQPDPLSLDSTSNQALLFTPESGAMDVKKEQ